MVLCANELEVGAQAAHRPGGLGPHRVPQMPAGTAFQDRVPPHPTVEIGAFSKNESLGHSPPPNCPSIRMVFSVISKMIVKYSIS